MDDVCEISVAITTFHLFLALFVSALDCINLSLSLSLSLSIYASIYKCVCVCVCMFVCVRQTFSPLALAPTLIYNTVCNIYK